MPCILFLVLVLDRIQGGSLLYGVTINTMKTYGGRQHVVFGSETPSPLFSSGIIVYEMWSY
jgi:hypothetical protein